jgi:multisubunit Na+/H+ antiporter MnhE subunit
MSVIMWILAKSYIHISCTILGRDYSPGVVTAAGIYIPGGVYFLVKWGGLGLLSWSNIIFSFLVGAILFMLLPTFARAVHFHAQLARIFHLVK